MFHWLKYRNHTHIYLICSIIMIYQNQESNEHVFTKDMKRSKFTYMVLLYLWSNILATFFWKNNWNYAKCILYEKTDIKIRISHSLKVQTVITRIKNAQIGVPSLSYKWYLMHYLEKKLNLIKLLMNTISLI